MQEGTITRRLTSAESELEAKFCTQYSETHFRRKIDALLDAGSKSSRPSILAELYDMFDACGIAYEKGRDNTYYVNLVRNTKLRSDDDIENDMLYALYSMYEKYPSPEAYMQRIVDRLSSQEDNWKTDTLRLRILKQFIKYGAYLADAGYGGRKTIQDFAKIRIGSKESLSEEEILSILTDDVFSGLETATKAQKKPGGKFGLLKLADDLAFGKFRAGGATRKGLYLFAMVYGMTYYSGAPDEFLNEKTDIEKNLFHDYYTDNMMRYISDAYKGKRCEFEEPTGQGINYKNFADAVYLYYICQDLPPQEKIKRSSQMIDRLQSNCKGKVAPANRSRKTTAQFRRMFVCSDSSRNQFNENLLRKTEEEFEQFLLDNYDCNTGKGAFSIGEMQLEAEQNTAFENYQRIIQKLRSVDVAPEDCTEGLWFTEIKDFRKNRFERLCQAHPEIDREKLSEFLELLLAVDRTLACSISSDTGATGGGDADSSAVKSTARTAIVPKSVTRTSLVVAYYYYFNARHEMDAPELSGQWNGFAELFKGFKREIDEYLIDSFYQPFSEHSIFDVLIAFSSYSRLTR